MLEGFLCAEAEALTVQVIGSEGSGKSCRILFEGAEIKRGLTSEVIKLVTGKVGITLAGKISLKEKGNSAFPCSWRVATVQRHSCGATFLGIEGTAAWQGSRRSAPRAGTRHMVEAAEEQGRWKTTGENRAVLRGDLQRKGGRRVPGR